MYVRRTSRLGRCQCREHGRQRLGVHGYLGQELAELRLVGGGHRRERIERREDEGLLLG